MTSQPVDDGEPNSTSLSVTRPAAARGQIRPQMRSAGDRCCVRDHLQSPGCRGEVADRAVKDSATDAVGQTTDAAGEATDNRQTAAGEVTDQAAGTLLSVARPTGRASRVTVRGGSPLSRVMTVVLPGALPEMTLRRSSTWPRSFSSSAEGSPEDGSSRKPHLAALLSSRPVATDVLHGAAARLQTKLPAPPAVDPPGQDRAGAGPEQQPRFLPKALPR